MGLEQDMLDSANSLVRNAMTIRQDSPNVAFQMLISAADKYEQLGLCNLSQNSLECAWEVQCDHLGGPGERKFGDLMRQARLRNFAKYLRGTEA